MRQLVSTAAPQQAIKSNKAVQPRF